MCKKVDKKAIGVDEWHIGSNSQQIGIKVLRHC